MVSTRTRDYSNSPLKRQRAAPKARKKANFRQYRIDKKVPCSKFVLFRKLPCELRLMIWEASMTPRIVAVKPNDGWSLQPPYLRKIVPAQLSVNRESRQCALRRYSLRFTINVTVDETGQHRRNCPSFEGKKYHANVVMSPDDTLGLLGWERLHMGLDHRYWFEVENADLVKCFGMQRNINNCGTQPQVKKVAFLREEIGCRPKIIHVLNSTVSCDVDSLLHGGSAKLSKFQPPRGSWYTSQPPSPDLKKYLWIHSFNFNGNLQEWGRRLLYRARHGSFRVRKAPHIFAFELGKQPEEFPRPEKLVTDRWEDPEGYYLSSEWAWRQAHPCPQGF